MTESDFIPLPYPAKITEGSFEWSAPSNIALVKYWGKKDNQIPANPSISFTLNNCKTVTKLAFTAKPNDGAITFDLTFEGNTKEEFRPKIAKFLQRVQKYVPFVTDFHFKIDTYNTFPHSSGIASSASGMAALAVNLMSIEKVLNPHITDSYFNQKASFLARLGSGSACRSIAGEIIVWGQHAHVSESSDLYGVPTPGTIHPVFHNFQDTILLVDKGEKQVSSTVGHDLMVGHPFAEQRFLQAHANLHKMLEILKNGDLQQFIEIVESEALTLHAMMMTSLPYYILMKPNTLQIINKIWDFRRKSGVAVCFTLDAGANVHVLYPESASLEVMQFIKDELVVHCQNAQYLCDSIGNGAQKISD